MFTFDGNIWLLSEHNDVIGPLQTSSTWKAKSFYMSIDAAPIVQDMPTESSQDSVNLFLMINVDIWLLDSH